MHIPSELPQDTETDENIDDQMNPIDNIENNITQELVQEEKLTEQQEDDIKRVLEIEIVKQRQRNRVGLTMVENSFEVKEPFFKQNNHFKEEDNEDEFENEYKQKDQTHQWPHLCLEEKGGR